jgi:cytochrome c oxidase cbb3-type subunit 3
MKYFKSLFLLINLALFSSNVLADDGQLITGMSNMSILIVALVFTTCFLLFAFLTLSATLANFINRDNPEEDKKKETTTFGVWFWSKFTQAVPIEKEQDIMLEHDYDGIRELDNQLPTWWKYLFWGSVIMSPIYLYYYSGSTPISVQEYRTEMEVAQAQKTANKKGQKGIDEENLTALEDATSISNGKDVYITNCASCHAPEAQGLIGPNLTDEFWLHGGSVGDVYKVVKEGVQGTAMLAWKEKMSAKQMHEVVSYIFSLQGSNPPNPKKAEGEKYIEGESNDKPSIEEEETTTEEVEEEETSGTAEIDAKAVFANKCVVCHGPEAQGTAIAPNLTDEFWKNDGSLEGILKTITDGVSGTAMTAFESQLKEGESKALAEYIINLEGSNPANPKEAEGEKYVR